MKIKRSGSYFVYQVFNTVVLTLVALTCIFPISACPCHVPEQQQCSYGGARDLCSGGIFPFRL